MKKLALIGCGQTGEVYADSLAKHGVLQAICDVDESRKTIADKYRCTFYSSAEQLLQEAKELDAVVIATPTGHHAEQAIKFLQARKDVIIAAPGCITIAAIWQMIETATFCRRKIYVVHQPITTDAAVQELLWASKEMPRFQLHYFSDFKVKTWRDESFPGGSVYHNTLLQPITLLTQLFGEVKEVVREQDSVTDSYKVTFDAQLQRAIGSLIRTKQQNANEHWTLEISTSSQSWKFTSSDQSAPSETSGIETANDYAKYFSPVLQWNTALETVPIIGALEKLTKATDTTTAN